MYYIYILEKDTDKTWYIGYTSDLRKRLSIFKEWIWT